MMLLHLQKEHGKEFDLKKYPGASEENIFKIMRG
jgi:hypothetical protein